VAAGLDAVAEQADAAAFWNMGENCSAGSRILIHAAEQLVWIKSP
jgi:gamma-glutamyl-gamma-aminobutyraldehyde dehydrogenase